MQKKTHETRVLTTSLKSGLHPSRVFDVFMSHSLVKKRLFGSMSRQKCKMVLLKNNERNKAQ